MGASVSPALFTAFGVPFLSDFSLPALASATEKTLDPAFFHYIKRASSTLVRPLEWTFDRKDAWGRVWSQVGHTPGGIVFDFPGRATFLWDRDSTVFVEAEDFCRTTQHLLLNQVLPDILAAKGHLMLHSAALQFDSSAVLLMGSTGAGKSSLTAAWIAAGHRWLSDDVTRVEPAANGRMGFSAVPGYPVVRLAPESGSLLAAAPVAATEPVADYTGKLAHAIPQRFGASPLPIAAVFCIDSSDRSVGDTATFREVSNPAPLLLEQSFRADPSHRGFLRDEFGRLMDFAGSLPFFRVTMPEGLGRLPSVVASMVAQARHLVAGQLPPRPSSIIPSP